MLKIQLTLFTAFILIVLIGCKKDEVLTDADGQRIAKIVETSGDSILYTIFNYDTDNRLIDVLDSNNNGYTIKTFIQYNQQNQPVKINAVHGNNSSLESTDSLIYNSSNQVIKKLFLSNLTNLYKVLNSYTYDSNGKLFADTMYDYWSDEVYGYTLFTYNASNNITEWQNFNKSTGSMQSAGVNNASYNTSPNPYSTLGLFAYFIKGNTFLLSNNNCVQVNYYDGTTVNYSYEYYSNGLPLKVLITDNQGSGSLSHTIEFFYN